MKTAYFTYLLLNIFVNEMLHVISQVSTRPLKVHLASVYDLRERHAV